ncbi:MAG: hypothetical protein F4Y07_15375 [Gemmatimonadetes bacterium]|nr:hypothetical protein [Gemmatimonadota bacterium]
MTGIPRGSRPTREYVLAHALLRAEAAGTLVEPAVGPGELTMDEAYAVGALIAGARLRRGWRFRGWKVGFTNRRIWPRWGLDRPMVAPVYRETVFEAGRDRDRRQAEPPLRIPAGQRAALRIEVEVVFGFQAAGPAEGAAAPDWVALGAELVDCHYPGWELHPARSVADFGLHAGLVVGPRVAPVPPRMLRALDGVAATLSAAGERLAEGNGHAVLGGPANVLAELRGSLSKRMAGYGVTGPDAPRDSESAGHPDTGPSPGEATDGGQGYLVSTGTLTPLVEARIGTTYEVAADLLPSFSFVLV